MMMETVFFISPKLIGGLLPPGTWIIFAPAVVVLILIVQRRRLALAWRRLVIIEDDVWLGARAILLPDVTIGRRSVVAAGSVVTRDVPVGALVGSNPAKVIRQIASQ